MLEVFHRGVESGSSLNMEKWTRVSHTRVSTYRVFFSSPVTSAIISPIPNRAKSPTAIRSEMLDDLRNYVMASSRNTTPITNITGELMG